MVMKMKLTSLDVKPAGLSAFSHDGVGWEGMLSASHPSLLSLAFASRVSLLGHKVPQRVVCMLIK
jgi:hypothetical protein